MIEYQKLIRDRIPEIIKASGKSYDVRTADKEQYKELLKKKLQEEVKEYLEEDNLEEVADTMELIYALASSIGYKEEDLEHKENGKGKKEVDLRRDQYWSGLIKQVFLH